MTKDSSRKLSPEIRATLDSLSQHAHAEAQCRKCGCTMLIIEADLWLYGSEDRWNLQFPLCVECNSESIRAMKFAA